MSQPEHYQMLVLGSGEGGKYLAWHMARSGHRTAVVERKLIGGSCPNTSCLPSKNEIWSAKAARSGRPRGSVRNDDWSDRHRYDRHRYKEGAGATGPPRGAACGCAFLPASAG